MNQTKAVAKKTIRKYKKNYPQNKIQQRKKLLTKVFDQTKTAYIKTNRDGSIASPMLLRGKKTFVDFLNLTK